MRKMPLGFVNIASYVYSIVTHDGILVGSVCIWWRPWVFTQNEVYGIVSKEFVNVYYDIAYR